MMKITLIRHGVTPWNAAKRMQGHVDIPLNDEGRTQAAAVAARLVDWPCEIIYASDLKRAAETARIISRRRNVRLVTDAAIRERNFGIFEGMFYSKAQREMRRLDEAGLPYPAAETIVAFCAKVHGFLEKILALGDKNIFVVSHGGTISVMICYLLGLPYERRHEFFVGNTSLYCFERQADSGFALVLKNDMSHLGFED